MQSMFENNKVQTMQLVWLGAPSGDCTLPALWNQNTNHYVGNLRDMNPIEYMKPCSKLIGVVFEGFQRCLITHRLKEESSNEYDNDLFIFQFTNFQYMLFRMMTYIENITLRA